MHRRTRREFLALGAAAAIGGARAHAWQGGQGPDADLVVFNARVYTMER